MKKINCILLIDDSPDDNFFHERIIKRCNAAHDVLIQLSAASALEALQPGSDHSINPDLIFLDINMPGMNGWDFLKEYKHLVQPIPDRRIIVMLTTSENPDDIKKAKDLGIVSDFKTKPITKEMLEEIMSSFF